MLSFMSPLFSLRHIFGRAGVIRPRILVVENECYVGQFVSELMDEVRIICADARDALRFLDAWHADLVILTDNVSESQIQDVIKSAADTETPLALAGEQTNVAGIAPLLLKPFTAEQLLGFVRSQLTAT